MTVDSTLYIAGPFIPVAVYDTVFHTVSPYINDSESEHISPALAQNLIGEWKGQIEDEDISIVFGENDSCSYSCQNLSFENVPYHRNSPQSGCIFIEYEENPIVIEVISQTSLAIRFKNSIHKGRKCTLYRI